MHTILDCDFQNFQSDLPNVAIMTSIQTGKFFYIFPSNQHLCTEYLKN